MKKKGWAKAKPKARKRPIKHRVRRDAKGEGDARPESDPARPVKALRTRKDGSIASGKADARRTREPVKAPGAAKPEAKRPRPPRRDEAVVGDRERLRGPAATPSERAAPPTARRREDAALKKAPVEQTAKNVADRGRTPRTRKDGSVAVGARVVREARAEAHASQSPQRIAKLLARAGVASRREIERMITEGRIALNGEVIDTPATILTTLAGVTVDGKPVDAAEASRLFLFHKPTGLITAAFDPAGRATIYDRLPPGLPRVIPVGRLDLNTEGLLLLTNDGELKRKLELPSTGIPRIYRARAYGEVTQEMLEALSDGVTIDGVRYGPIDANMERRTGRNVWIEIRITEGKNREVRRVLEYLGLQVSRLIRTAYGEFVLADLPAGQVVEVRQHDLEEFRKTIR
ncbi:ribosomal large subunit pseudouridine synthase B [Nostoc sp. 3335mG]|nr:ribosomal large subunit pseudouridine synthase B [Nostoc sp. 3335mG]